MKIFNEKFHPCCGFFLRGAARWLAILNMVMIGVGIGLLVLDVFQLWDKWQKEKIEKIGDYYFRLFLWIGYVIHASTTVPMDYVFYVSCQTNNIRNLRIFIISTLINNTIGLLIYYIHTFKFGIHLPTLAIYNGYLFYKYYVCLIVHYLIKDIEEDLEQASVERALTQKEIEEFEEGVAPLPVDFDTKTLLEKAPYQRYKKEDFELPIDDLRFEMGNPLGCGAYGAVYRAQLHKKDGYEVTVAVKTIDPSQTDVLYFKALLTELKIMSYIGKHEHVVDLIGASTAEIRNRKLYIVLEFCAFGNLNCFLRGSRVMFTNMVRSGTIRVAPATANNYDKIPFDADEGLNTLDLIRFAREIASGMEYLASRKVVHGDLATRNVLLTGKKVIKITDFGLARQLYSYSVYVKKQNTPLPWRWLALESLADMNFSTYSDIWAYGVTIWEIFTLAEIPWPGCDFTFAFVEQLKQGMRMKIPQYATDDLYQLMMQCWNESPTQRPNFTTIVQLLTENFQAALTGKEVRRRTSSATKQKNTIIPKVNLDSKETQV